MQFTINLKNGVKAKQQTAGSYFLILDDGGSGAIIDTTFRQGAHIVEEIRTAKRGTKARMAHGQFTSIEMTSDRDCTLEIIISDGAVDVDYFAGANVNATIAGPHVGTVGDPIYVANLSAPPAVSVTDGAGVALTGAAATLIAAAVANRRAIRFSNTGTDPYTIGAVGITWATRTIVINPGDTWLENDAANLAWYGITDVGKSATAQSQGIGT